MSRAIDDVIDERRRQIEVEGWTEAHDDEHIHHELAIAGACYALHDTAAELYNDRGLAFLPSQWPLSWDIGWWKPKTRRRNLVRAAALIIAEIERLDRQDGDHS